MNKLLSLFTRDNLSRFEKYAILFIYYVLPGIILITLIVAGLATGNPGYSRQAGRGENGRQLLTIVLFIKPIIFLARKYRNAQLMTMNDLIISLSKLPTFFKTTILNLTILQTQTIPFLINAIYSISTYLMRFRRQLGIAAFWCILAHGLLWEIFWIRQNLPVFFGLSESGTLFGTLGLIALLIGAITSNTYAIQKLKANRKPVQMVAYLAFFFGALHTGNLFWVIVYAVAKYFERKDSPVFQQRLQRILTNPTIKFLYEKIKQKIAQLSKGKFAK